MAGAGYKLFSTGDVLSASDVNTYLQQQTVMVFASAAARTTALASVLAEGMVTYLKDTDVVEIYTGAAWVSLDDPNAIQNTLLTTTGDTIYASSANTPARRAIGTSGQVLTVSGGVPVWSTPAGGGGKLLQMQAASTTGQLITSSATYADTGLTVTITPSSASSRIFIQGSFNYRKSPGSSGNRANIRIMRGATQIYEDTDQLWTDSAIYNNSNYCLSFLDSPATTSATTYKIQGANANGTANVIFNYSAQTVSIYASEIGA